MSTELREDQLVRDEREVQRFWSHVDKSGECWLWRASLHNGYGVFRVKRGRWKHVQAHRYAFELGHGPIPKGLEGCHRCDTPACVRPDHIFLGTHAENMADMLAKGRRDHVRKMFCIRGHPFTPENTRIHNNRRVPNGVRVCIACYRMHARVQRAKAKRRNAA